jgi:hypothetical protein
VIHDDLVCNWSASKPRRQAAQDPPECQTMTRLINHRSSDKPWSLSQTSSKQREGLLILPWSYTKLCLAAKVAVHARAGNNASFQPSWKQTHT